MEIPENHRLLIIDDEPEIRQSYRMILKPETPNTIFSSRTPRTTQDRAKTGYEKLELIDATNGDEALTLLKKELSEGRKFAGAFVDVRMPGKLNGIQFVQEAWKQDPNLQIVVVTAYPEHSVDEIHRFFDSPYQDQWDYLNKPFTSGEIIQKTRQMISSYNRRIREKNYVERIKQHQQVLLEQERLAAVGRLARSVGHEFGNILQPLLTLIEITKEKVNQTGSLSEVNSALDEMLEAVALGSNICQDLLTFSRDSFPSLVEPTPPEISIQSAIHKALRLLRHEIQRKDIQVHISCAPEIRVLFHEPRLVQVLVNLIKNSVEAVSDGGTLRIDGQRSLNKFELCIEDDGYGISEENMKNLFKPLFSTKGSLGNGIGLIASKQIMEDYKGKITIKSLINKGTTVNLEFPLNSI